MTTESEATLDNEPRLVRRADVSPLLWGDEEAGYANDLFYQLTPQLAIVVACIPPGGTFTSSEHPSNITKSRMLGMVRLNIICIVRDVWPQAPTHACSKASTVSIDPPCESGAPG